jgi:MFS family permease
MQPFIRDRLTWLAYIMLAYIGFNQAMLGPLMPSLRSELGLSYTQGGFLPASLAIGLIVSGLISDRLARLWGRRVVFWSGGVGLATGVVLLALSRRFESLLVAALCIGLSSSLTQIMIQAILADQHGERRAIALTEANVGASLSTSVTPLAIGALQRLYIDWRAISVLTMLFLASVVATFHRQGIPDGVESKTQSQSGKGGGRLPFFFWIYWAVLFLVVAMEMSMAVWATEFFSSVVNLSQADAVLAFSAFPAAMLIGRFTGSRLTHHWSTQRLLLTALIVVLIGFPIFLYAPLPAFNVLGLFISGLGIANLYPSTLAVAVGLAAEQSNQASARASMAVGIALLTVPLSLGWLADRLGLRIAYGMVILLILAAIAVVISNRYVLERRKVVHS